VASGTRVDVEPGQHIVISEAEQGDVYALIRPNAVALYRSEPEGSPRNLWRGPIESVELLGERVRVRVAGSLPLVADVTPSAVRDLGLEEGVEIWASVKATEVLTYSA
jgi:molybdate transport system ATP-binding protein